ncbi:aminopeptidase [Bacillus licheniformis]|nr:aminopeptidase [Bacillus licheniformis]
METDEGSHYLGEIALVAHDSPISKSNILFTTHCLMKCLKPPRDRQCIRIQHRRRKQMSREELAKEGLNESITHVDFMIGSGEMNIDGITADGKESRYSETATGRYKAFRKKDLRNF